LGRTVSGLYYSNAKTAYVGLFGYICGGDIYADIHEVVIDNSYFYGQTRVGGIAGYATRAEIEKCTNFAIVNAAEKGSNYESCAGGIAGEIKNAIVSNNVNYGKVSSDGRLTGGVVGLMGGVAEVCNCVNFGFVTGSSRIGGIVGCMDGKNTYVVNNYNMGNVRPNDGSNDYIGAIVGRNVDDNGTAQFNYYLKDCAKGGNNKSRYAMGKDGGSVEDGAKDYIASSFESYESVLNSSADECAGMTLLDALNHTANQYSAFSSWVNEGPNGYPLHIASYTSTLRLVP
jgi:hypothetical protein